MKNAATFLYTSTKILLLRKRDGKYKGQWSGPGGHMERSETPRAAAERELMEETGLCFDKLGGQEKEVLEHDNKTKIYMLKINRIKPVKLSEEHDKYEWVKFKDLKNYPLTYYAQDVVDYVMDNDLI
jgi:8-oxo-dGTP diphosphatase